MHDPSEHPPKLALLSHCKPRRGGVTGSLLFPLSLTGRSSDDLLKAAAVVLCLPAPSSIRQRQVVERGHVCACVQTARLGTILKMYQVHLM